MNPSIAARCAIIPSKRMFARSTSSMMNRPGAAGRLTSTAQAQPPDGLRVLQTMTRRCKPNPFGADDPTPVAIHVDDEVARLQIEDRTSVAVDDRDVDGDHLDAALEPRRLLILRVGGLRGDQRDGDDNMKSSHNCTSGRSGPFFSV